MHGIQWALFRALSEHRLHGFHHASLGREGTQYYVPEKGAKPFHHPQIALFYVFVIKLVAINCNYK